LLVFHLEYYHHPIEHPNQHHAGKHTQIYSPNHLETAQTVRKSGMVRDQNVEVVDVAIATWADVDAMAEKETQCQRVGNEVWTVFILELQQVRSVKAPRDTLFL
jgi:hypothetical protein